MLSPFRNWGSNLVEPCLQGTSPGVPMQQSRVAIDDDALMNSDGLFSTGLG